ncbi:MAG: hypothetical protein HN353_00290 [Bdellovibrionales bacterium]|jgi:hypothetical protein|nr:hypothetical protein [Bdellovibrionales bacterium]MBT3524654.1 hypothetical protein [Bdellovibrionales bacterium]
MKLKNTILTLLLTLVGVITFSQSVQAAPVTIKGRVVWTDAAGATHPARFMRVMVYDQETVGGPRLLSILTAGADGRYKTTMENDDGIGAGGLDISVEIKSHDHIFKIGVGRMVGGKFTFYTQSSTTHDNVADNSTTTINFTATGPVNKAFSIADALIEGVVHASKKKLAYGNTSGQRYMRVFFPTGDNEYISSTKHINISNADALDWDIVLHEYGHHIADMNRIKLAPGVHWTDVNLTRTHGKDLGNQIALSEGFASFFSIAAQKAENTRVLGVSGAGDLIWNQRSDQFGLEQNHTPLKVSHMGEDNEVAVARILWDVMDGASDDLEIISEGDTSVYKKLSGGNNLSDYWNRLIKGKPLKKKLDYARIFITHGVAPEQDESLSGKALSAGNALHWMAQGTKTAYHLNEFKILISDPTISKVIHTIPVPKASTVNCSKRGPIWQNPTCSYILSNQDVLNINAALVANGFAAGSAMWIVEGQENQYNPKTGDYLSLALPLTGGGEVSWIQIDPEEYAWLVSELAERGEIAQWGDYYNLSYSSEHNGILAYSIDDTLVVLIPRTDDGGQPDPPAVIDLGEVRTEKFVATTRLFNVSQYNLREIVLEGSRKEVNVHRAEILFRSGERELMPTLSGFLREGQRKSVFIINGSRIKSIAITAQSANIFGSRGKYKVYIGVKKVPADLWD